MLKTLYYEQIQAQLMKNSFNRGNASTKESVVEGQALNAFKGGLSLQVIMQSGNIEESRDWEEMIKNGILRNTFELKCKELKEIYQNSKLK